MNLKHLLIMFVLVGGYCFGQDQSTNFEFVPERPAIGQPISFVYKPTSFTFANNVTCLAYFSGISQYPEVDIVDFPRVVEVSLLKSADGWTGRIDTIPKNSTAIVVVFFDSLGQKDSNDGKGYWSPLYFNSKRLPGALSGLAAMLYGNVNRDVSHFNLKFDVNLAKELYEADFELNPEIKRNFIRPYLATLDFNTDEEKNRLKLELNSYANSPDLSEWDLKSIGETYGRLNDTLLAKEYNKLIFERFPNGSWAMQTTSLKMLMSIGVSTNLAVQKAIYGEFKDAFTRSFPDEFTRRIMSLRRGRMLGYMAKFYANEGTLAVWEKEVDELDVEFRPYAYRDAARYALDYIEREQRKNLIKNGATEPSPFVYTLMEENMLARTAETLARKSADLWKKNINAPRTYVDALALTDDQVRTFREERRGDFLDILGQALIVQNKFDEAVVVLREAAITTAKRKNASINERYVESLVKAGRIDDAINEVETLLTLGKSSEKIDRIYSGLKNDDKSLDSLKSDAVKSIESKIKALLINEEAPDFVFYDLNGNEISSSRYKNKIIVIDFWASWCPPCMIGLSSMEPVVDRYRDNRNVVFLLVNVEKTKSRALSVINKKKDKSNFAFDSVKGESMKFIVNGLPARIIIDEKGRIRFRTVGITTYSIREQTGELLAMLKIIENE